MENNNLLKLNDIYTEINYFSKWYDHFSKRLLGGNELDSWFVFLWGVLFLFVFLFSFSHQIFIDFLALYVFYFFLFGYPIHSGFTAEICRNKNLCLINVVSICNSANCATQFLIKNPTPWVLSNFEKFFNSITLIFSHS